MKIREKNPALRKLIMELEKASRKNKAPAWKAVARGLNRPARKGFEVTLFDLEKACSPKETIVVPGKVLAKGELAKPLNIAALSFSGKAREAIEKSRGKPLTIMELVEKNPKGSGIRILG